MKSIAAFLLCLLPVSASAEHANHWSYVGAWDVDYYSDLQGCGALVAFDGGTGFFIGFDTNSDQALLAIGITDPSWTGITVGDSYELTVAFDSRTPWNVTATGTEIGGDYGLVITEPVNSGSAADFASEFARSYWMTWSHRGDVLGKLSLKNSHLAFNTALDCTQSVLQ